MRANVSFLLLLTFGICAEASTPTLEALSEVAQKLSRQIQLQQFHFQESIRSEGSAGIKQLRIRKSGTKNYYTENFIGRSIATIHTHSDYKFVAGLGEFVGVLNGVEFKTRHNDYLIVTPSKNSTDFHAVDPMPFPDVPPEVLNKKTLDDQVVELREWFKAWKHQNKTHRNYPQYFRPILCYLEGAWFKVNPDGDIQESFASDRHSLDASKWSSLHERAMFMAYTGGKSRLENLAVLPTGFMGTINGTIFPQTVQYNYRILCHPLKNDLPLKHLHVEEDLSNRLDPTKPKPMDVHITSRSARFGLNADKSGKVGKPYTYGLLDELMAQIPGKDNYKGRIYSKDTDNEKVMKHNGKYKLNMAFYNRFYRTTAKDAMGENMVHRTYSDDFGFGAQTSHEEIAGLDYTADKPMWVECRIGSPGCDQAGRKKVFFTKHEKWTWAVPLEIIYLTPLHNWNPHNIEYKEGSKEAEVSNRDVKDATLRNGGCTEEKAYNGAQRAIYYRTPVEFFASTKSKGDKADTVRKSVCALNAKGEMVTVAASGVYVKLPEIQDVGALRIRYPIMPVHGEGDVTWKELNAVRELVMNKDTLQYLIAGNENAAPSNSGHDFLTGHSTTGDVAKHQHEVSLTSDQVNDLKANKKVAPVDTSQVTGHTHSLQLKYENGKIMFSTCDNKPKCWDGHGNVLI